MSYQIPSSHYQSENFENSIRKSSYNSPHNFNEHHHRNRSVSNITSINSSARNSPTLSNSRPSSSGSSNCSTSPFLGSRSNLHSVGIGHPSNSGFKIKKPRSMAVKLLYLSCLAVGFMGFTFYYRGITSIILNFKLSLPLQTLLLQILLLRQINS